MRERAQLGDVVGERRSAGARGMTVFGHERV
jgi:hypothetical protein